jgi:uncharacterized protein YkwD
MMLVSPDNTAGRRAPPHSPWRALAAGALAAGVCVWLTAGACAGPDDDALAVTSALGEPMGDFPGYEERVVLYATNRARVSPTVEGWPSYPAQPPMQWNYALNQSSRAHSLDMRNTPCFQHPSCDGTDPFVRVQTYYTGPWSSLAENIAAGGADPQTTVHNWIYEIGAAAGETGHRDAIFSASLTLIGVGFAPGGMTPTTKLQNFWTQDFVGTSVKRPRLTDGIHFPKSAAAGGKITFGATYYDAAVGAGKPQVFAVVDGACTGLAFVRGTTALGAYEGAAALADGCHSYYFVATLGDGVALATYPDTGALQVGTGSAAATCALFATTRAAATCGGMGGGGTGAAGSGTMSGAAGAGGGGTMSGAAGSGTMSGAAGMKGTGAGGTTGAAGSGTMSGAGGATGTAGAAGSGTTSGAGGATGTDGSGTMSGAGAGGSGTMSGAAGAGTGGSGTISGAAGAGVGPGAAGATGGTSAAPLTGAAGAPADHGGSIVGKGCSVASSASSGTTSSVGLLVALFVLARRPLARRRSRRGATSS